MSNPNLPPGVRQSDLDDPEPDDGELGFSEAEIENADQYEDDEP